MVRQQPYAKTIEVRVIVVGEKMGSYRCRREKASMVRGWMLRQTNRHYGAACLSYDPLGSAAEEDMVYAASAVSPEDYQRHLFFIGLLQYFVVGDAGDDLGFVVVEILDLGPTEFLHHLFCACLDFLLEFLERDVGNVKAAQIHRFVDDVNENQPRVELAGQCVGVIEGVIRAFGKISGEKNLVERLHIIPRAKESRPSNGSVCRLEDLLQDGLELFNLHRFVDVLKRSQVHGFYV